MNFYLHLEDVLEESEETSSAALLCYYGGYFFRLKTDIRGHLWVFAILMRAIDCGAGRGLDDK